MYVGVQISPNTPSPPNRLENHGLASALERRSIRDFILQFLRPNLKKYHFKLFTISGNKIKRV